MGIYESQAYSDLSEAEIFCRLTAEGYSPSRIIDAPGAVYENHKNSYDLILAFLYGSAEVRISEHVYHCVPGDKLNIPGSQPHSAVIGNQGVVYLMTQVVSGAD